MWCRLSSSSLSSSPPPPSLLSSASAHRSAPPAGPHQPWSARPPDPWPPCRRAQPGGGGGANSLRSCARTATPMAAREAASADLTSMSGAVASACSLCSCSRSSSIDSFWPSAASGWLCCSSVRAASGASTESLPKVEAASCSSPLGLPAPASTTPCAHKPRCRATPTPPLSLPRYISARASRAAAARSYSPRMSVHASEPSNRRAVGAFLPWPPTWLASAFAMLRSAASLEPGAAADCVAASVELRASVVVAASAASAAALVEASAVFGRATAVLAASTDASAAAVVSASSERSAASVASAELACSCV
mmetsp:Transcript_27854/g.85031  ORF Transcript_27854/g.85031 Transcript_27854/m.85031 type:complete len:309 (-) Transcript_27854:877-1803(-)